MCFLLLKGDFMCSTVWLQRQKSRSKLYVKNRSSSGCQVTRRLTSQVGPESLSAMMARLLGGSGAVTGKDPPPLGIRSCITLAYDAEPPHLIGGNCGASYREATRL